MDSNPAPGIRRLGTGSTPSTAKEWVTSDRPVNGKTRFSGRTIDAQRRHDPCEALVDGVIDVLR